MNRLPDWPERLADHIQGAETLQFAWGETDCCLWACDGIEAMTGIDPAQWFRGRYRDKAGAGQALRDFAGGGLDRAARKLAAAHGYPPLAAPLYARRGDLLLCRGLQSWPDGLGLCIGNSAAVFTPSGLRHVSLKETAMGWRI